MRTSPLAAALSPHVASGGLPGFVALLATPDRVELELGGTLGIGDSRPTRRDMLFRISSMTKPITAAAAMVLVQRGVLTLDGSVERWLPELANRRVLRDPRGPLDDTVPAERTITLRDLLTFRLGFGMLWGAADAPVVAAVEKLNLMAFGPPQPRVQPPPDEWMRRFATLPLMHQPGAQWRYNTGSEILGVLLARAGQAPLEDILREALLQPLGMTDTSFSVPTDRRDRLPVSYFAHPERGLEVYDAVDGAWSEPPAFPSAAAGLVSTADDLLAFGRMLLAGGRHQGRVVLTEESVAEMTRDQITPEQKRASEDSLAPGFWQHRGWGLGAAVQLADVTDGPLRGHGWSGGLGTAGYCLTEHGAVALLLTQRSEYPDFSPIHRDFWRAVRESLPPR